MIHLQLGAGTKLQLCVEQYHCQCPRLLLHSTTYLRQPVCSSQLELSEPQNPTVYGTLSYVCYIHGLHFVADEDPRGRNISLQFTPRLRDCSTTSPLGYVLYILNMARMASTYIHTQILKTALQHFGNLL